MYVELAPILRRKRKCQHRGIKGAFELAAVFAPRPIRPPALESRESVYKLRVLGKTPRPNLLAVVESSYQVRCGVGVELRHVCTIECRDTEYWLTSGHCIPEADQGAKRRY
jgi:hypothetical protein